MVKHLSLFAACIIGLTAPVYAAEPSAPTTGQGIVAIGSMPSRGMTMAQVEQYFGAPQQKLDPVGHPPISRWVYEGFIVYFEGQYVIHALATDDKNE